MASELMQARLIGQEEEKMTERIYNFSAGPAVLPARLGRTEEDHGNRPQRARLAEPGPGGRGAVTGAGLRDHRARRPEPAYLPPGGTPPGPDARQRWRQP